MLKINLKLIDLLINLIIKTNVLSVQSRNLGRIRKSLVSVSKFIAGNPRRVTFRSVFVVLELLKLRAESFSYFLAI